MDIVREEMERLLQFLYFWREIFSKELKKSPPGGLTLMRQGNKGQYLSSVPNGRYPSGQIRYAKEVLKEDSEMLQKLVLKEYYRVALRILSRNIYVMERAIESFLSMDFRAIRAGMRKTYQNFSDDLFRNAFLAQPLSQRQLQWARESYEQSDYRPEEKTEITSRGLKVRSRAEVLIAEMLYMYNIPFRYEQVVYAGKYKLAPDFTFLGADGKEFYWEYCGMMSIPKYIEKQLWRRKTYESVGINEWTDMIYTYDDKDGIDMREIEAIIKTKILPRVQIEETTGLSSKKEA